MTNCLEVKSLTIKNIFQNVTFKLHKGEILCVLGPNGAGKTTLLKTILGLKHAHSGHIIKNRNLKISYIPQHLGLVKNKSVHYNIMLGFLPKLNFWQSLFKKYPPEAIKKADYLMEFFQLEKRKNNKVYTLSGGEKRSLAIARALMLSPDVILADEIFSDLDFLKSKLIISKLKKLQTDGISMILIEHDLCVAREISSKIALLNNQEFKTDVDIKEISELKLCKFFN